ncbi:MAG: Mur ligase domain-containing protein [Candidatus Gracilibacteria bacterium]|jgi:UDP-N-acetylmuramate--alanine ligase
MSFFEDQNEVYCIGIGGIGMSGLARLLKAFGKTVLGSDISASSTTAELEADGIPVLLGHLPENLPESTELVVYSEAIPEGNPELVHARALGIPTMTYFEALGEVTKNYRLIAIAGTHGKTTTTAMLGLILETAGLDPTVLLGSKLKEFGNRNVKVGESDLFVLEACEYRRNFMSLHPELLGITNIELDHLDYFKNQADYEAAFKDLAAQSGEVIWPEDSAEYEGELGLPGAHNALDAGLAAQMARRLGVSEGAIAEALKEYKGAWRRFEYKGITVEGATLYDDYAHHPSEVQATLAGAREKYPEARIVAVFQPHQYSRTAALLEAFAESFEDADEVIIPNIYEARDTDADKHAVSVERLVEEISHHHDNVKDGEGIVATAEYLNDTVGDGDLVILMGAGDIGKIAEDLLL